MESRVAIVGGGVSGLATAFFLKKAGIPSFIFEASGRLGGLVQTDRVSGCDLEAGPDSFIATKPAVTELAGELGIADQLIGSNDGSRRIFLVRDGKLTPMPQGMVMMVPSDWTAALKSTLFSPATKLRFIREYFDKPRHRDDDFSIRDMILDHFGEEALHYIAEPLLSGVYGGSAGSLSARSVLPRFVDYETNYGSLIKGVRGAKSGTVPGGSLFLSFRGGMQTLTSELVRRVGDDVLYQQVTAIFPNELGWVVETNEGSVKASHVVLACPAHRSSNLLRDSDRALSSLLDSIHYSSSILVTLLFRKDDFGHPLNGFGFLVPPPERQTLAAVTWINTKFPSRVAEDLVAMRAFLVDPESNRHAGTSDQDVIEAVVRDLKKFMGISVAPEYSKVHRWPKSMPQYTVGHAKRIEQIEGALAARCPGLHLASNYLDGVGIPDCVRRAQSVALSIAKHKQ